MKVWKCDICGKVEPRSIRRIVAFNPDVNDSPLNSEEIYGFNLFHGEFCEDCLYKIERAISKEIDKLKRENNKKTDNEKNEIRCYALHLLSENPIEEMLSQEVIDVVKESVDIHPTPNSVMILFKDETDMKEWGEKLKAKGLKIAYEVEPVYIDKKNIDREVKK